MSRQAMEMALDCLLYYNRREAYPRPESPTSKTIKALRDALAESAVAEPVESTGGTFVEQIAEAKRDMAQWPQWMQDAAHVSAAVAHPPAREAAPVVNQQLTTELSDEELIATARRVAWVEANPAHHAMPYFLRGKWIVAAPLNAEGCGYRTFDTWAEAIDAAMQEKP